MCSSRPKATRAGGGTFVRYHRRAGWRRPEMPRPAGVLLDQGRRQHQCASATSADRWTPIGHALADSFQATSVDTVLIGAHPSEASAEPGEVPWLWIQYAYRGYLLLQDVDRRLLEPRLPPALFYNLMVAARRP